MLFCRVMDFSEGGWAEPEQVHPEEAQPEQAQPTEPQPEEAPFVEALGSDGLSPSHPEDWAAPEVNQGTSNFVVLIHFST